MSNVILFDMDGTLTPSRKKVDDKVIYMLYLLNHNKNIRKVGIITGSGYNYIEDQMEKFLDLLISDLDPEKFILLPCNGTQSYEFFEEGHFGISSSVSMRAKLGDKAFELLIKQLVYLQHSLTTAFPDLPVSGHFVSNRGSTINWSPVGRDAPSDLRRKFVKYDKEKGVRSAAKRMIEDSLKTQHELLPDFGGLASGITVALGGETSLDIYPDGWDKTFPLDRFKDDKVWFIGDKCQENGNDKAIYDRFVEFGRAFETSGPEETVSIVYRKIMPFLINN